jgi:DNA replication and repair protein RecF
MAQGRVLQEETGVSPLFLIDDIFGELDPKRRNALLAYLPPDAQKFVTATTLQWAEPMAEGRLFHLSDKNVLIKP